MRVCDMKHRTNRIFTIVLVAIWSCYLLVNSGLIYADTLNPPAKNLEFINVDLRQVFRSLAANGGFTVILDQTVTGNGSIAFNTGITAKEAVAVIANNYGFSYQWLPGSETIFIGNIKAFPNGFGEKTANDVQLKFIDAATVANSLEIVVPKDRIKPDSNGKKVTVFGNPLELLNVNEIVARIDREITVVNVEMKIAEVSDDFWSDTGINPAVIRTHIGVYPLAELKAKQFNSISNSSHPTIHFLARQSSSLYDNQAGKYSFGDKISTSPEKDKNQTETQGTQLKNVFIGSTVQIVSWIGAGNLITLQVKELTETMNPSPGDSKAISEITQREVTSIITLEAGQSFLLTGLIGREEFNRIQTVPGQYPHLNELFSSGGPVKFDTKAGFMTVMMITPKFTDNSNESTLQNTNNKYDSINSNGTQIDGVNVNSIETKTQVVIAPPLSPTPIAVPTKVTKSSSVTVIDYTVKKGDTVKGIASKFGIDPILLIRSQSLE